MIDFRLVGILSLILAAIQIADGNYWLAGLHIAGGAFWVWLDRRHLREVLEVRRRKAEARAKWSDNA